MLRFNDETKTIQMIAKDTGDLTVSISNYRLADGDSLFFTVNKELEKKDPLISIEITSFVNDCAVIRLSKENTDLPVGDYYYDIQVNTADGRVDTVLGPAKFKIMGGVKF